MFEIQRQTQRWTALVMCAVLSWAGGALADPPEPAQDISLDTADSDSAARQLTLRRNGRFNGLNGAMDPEGTLRLDTNISITRISYAVNDHFSIGGDVILPVALVGGGISLKFGDDITPYVRFATTLSGGGIVMLQDIDAIAYQYGEMAFEFGTRGTYATLGARSLFFQGPSGDGPGAVGFVAALAGGAVSVAEIVQLHFAAGPVFGFALGNTSDDSLGFGNDGKSWIIQYGVRLQGEKFFGDLGFVMPIIPDVTSEFIRYLPLGLPAFSFGAYL